MKYLMEESAESRQRYILMSHRKLRRIANVVRGKTASEAINILRFMPHFASDVVLKNLTAAVSNINEKLGEDISSDELVVSHISIDEGPAYRRFKPRAQGRIYKIQKPTAHLTIRVSRKP